MSASTRRFHAGRSVRARSFVLLMCAAAPWLAAGCTVLPARMRHVPADVTLPGESGRLDIHWVGEFPLAIVSIEGVGPFHFLIDTGAGESVVSPDVARLLPERVRGQRRSVRGVSGKLVGIRQDLFVSTLACGEVTLAGFHASVIDLSDVSDALGADVDGILGCPAMQDLVLVIDYPGKTVTLRRGSLEDEEGKTQFKFSNATRPHVMLKIGERPIPVLVDSGSSSGISLTEKWLSGLTWEAQPVDAGTSVGITGSPRPWKAGRLAGEARIGTHVLDRPVIQTIYKSPLIGARLLKHFTLSYDRKSRRVRLERASDRPIQSEPLRGTGVALRRRGRTWRVWRIESYATEARSGRPAAEWISEGDVISHVDRRPVASFDYAAFKSLIASRDEISMTIRGEGGPREILLAVNERVP